MAVCELCEAADALILPVRLNFVKPTAPFPLTNTQADGSLGCHEMFEVDALQRHFSPRNSPPVSRSNIFGSGNDANQSNENVLPPSSLSSSVSSRVSGRRLRDSVLHSQQGHGNENDGTIY